MTAIERVSAAGDRILGQPGRLLISSNGTRPPLRSSR